MSLLGIQGKENWAKEALVEIHLEIMFISISKIRNAGNHLTG